MSNKSLDNQIKALEERLENEKRITRDGSYNNQSRLPASRPNSGQRTKPSLVFSPREFSAVPPRYPHYAEQENRLQEVCKMSGKLKVNGVEYVSRVEDLQHLGELGSGTCGYVVKMLHKPSLTIIAVKQMRRSGNSDETKRILMDLDVVVRSNGCAYIVRCLGCFVTDADVWICMELMASCFDKLLKRLGAPIPEEILGKVTVATVNALSYLKETHDVIHRDVKPSNILIDERGNIKLCDFGISGRLVDSKAKTRSAGCAAYMAPERIDPPDPMQPDYDIRADVWSLGISLVELATGVFPYRDCQNDFEVLTRVIAEAPPTLPESSDFTPEFKSFVNQCLIKNYKDRPKYTVLLKHPFVANSKRSSVSVGKWYASLPNPSQSPAAPAPTITTVASHQVAAVSNGSPMLAPRTVPSYVHPVQRNYVTSIATQWSPELATPTPPRAWWATPSVVAGGSSSQPASLETDFANHSPYPRRRTLEACTSPPPPPPARRVSVDSRSRPSPSGSANTSPMVLQRFYHQNQQRRSRVDLNSTPRHRSLSREHSTGRSPEPPPRSSRQMLGLEAVNGGSEADAPALHERLQAHSPLLLHKRLSEGRSQSLTRAELQNGWRADAAPLAPPRPARHHHDDQGWLHSLAGLVKRRLTSYVKWHHVVGSQQPQQPTRQLSRAPRWGNAESWSMPASPLPPRAPPPRPAD